MEENPHPSYAPLTALFSEKLVTPKWLAERWSVGHSHLSNMRRERRGMSYIRLPTGARGKGSIRYRASDVLAAEITGYLGALNLQRVLTVLATCPVLTETQSAAVQAYLQRELSR